MISFSCNNCGKGFRVSGDKGGKTARCPGCGHLLQVPVANNAPRPTEVRQRQNEPSHNSEHRRRHHQISPEVHARAKLAGRQRANLILLGVVLLIGFLMPIVHDNGPQRPRSFDMVNITILGKIPAPPMSIKVICLVPGVAGVGLLVLQVLTKHPLRGIMILFMAVVPILIALADLQLVRAMTGSQKATPTGNTLAMTLCFLGLFAAPVAMLVGIRSRSYQPDNHTAYYFGVAGAVLWLVFLVTPALPAEMGHIFLMVPIKLITNTGPSAQSIGLIAIAACMTVTAALCIVNTPSTEFMKARKLAGTAFLTFIIGVTVLLLCLVGQAVGSFPLLVATIKYVCWFGGVFMLLPAGITDLVVGHIHHPKHARHDDQQPPQAYEAAGSGRPV